MPGFAGSRHEQLELFRSGRRAGPGAGIGGDRPRGGDRGDRPRGGDLRRPSAGREPDSPSPTERAERTRIADGREEELAGTGAATSPRRRVRGGLQHGDDAAREVFRPSGKIRRSRPRRRRRDRQRRPVSTSPPRAPPRIGLSASSPPPRPVPGRYYDLEKWEMQEYERKKRGEASNGGVRTTFDDEREREAEMRRERDAASNRNVPVGPPLSTRRRRGGAAVASWIFRRTLAAAPWLPAGYSADAAAPRPPAGYSAERRRGC